MKGADVGPKNMSLAFGTGLLAGSLGGMIGLGGGFVALPIMTGPMGLSNHLAHGTSMMAVLFTSLGGAYAYSQSTHSSNEKKVAADKNNHINSNSYDIINNKQSDINKEVESYIDRIFDNVVSHFHFDNLGLTGHVDLPVALGSALASTIFAVIGARLSARLSSETLRICRGVMQMCMAPSILIRDGLKSEGEKYQNNAHNNQRTQQGDSPSGEDNNHHHLNHHRLGKSLAIGSFAGLQAGIFGVGGGAILVPCFCIGMDMDYKVSIATSLASMMPTAISGGLTHFLQGTMITRIGIPMGVGCFLGSFTSGSIVPYMNDQYLKYGFTGLIFSIGAKTLFFAKKVVK